MTSIDFRQTSLEHLHQLRQQIEQAIAEKEGEVLEQLKKETLKRAKELGLKNIDTLFPKAKKRRGIPKGTKLEPKYRNPANPDETWSGKGSRPLWLRDYIQAGGTLSELLIK